MQRYTPQARALHWIIALLVALMFVLGIWVVFATPKDQALEDRLYTLHESTGMVIWVLVLVRLAIRRANPPPPLPAGTPRLVRLGAAVNHGALYALLFVQPIVGFLDTNAWNAPVVWYGIVPIPSPIAPDKVLAPRLSLLHKGIAILILLAVLTHLAGVAYHQVVRRDRLLRRML
jgi:cytochrome b561